jgi:hypothetical protein
MMVYSIVAIEYPQDPQNHDEHDKHGSGEPVKEHNDIILLAIYNAYNVIYRSTECTQFTPLFFASISFEPTAYLLNLLAMKTCRNNVPEGLAKMTRQNNLPWQLAEFKCDSKPRRQ